jgi:nifR3 family TIM-barrel protein
MKNFWQHLYKPFFVSAPLADVTDVAFRSILAKYGKPDVMWTEFVSADGLALAPEEGRKKLMADLLYTEAERPIVAQLFSSNGTHMEAAARLCQELGFDGIDINMGCPDRSIEKQGCGAAMIKTPDIAKKIIQAAKLGAPDLPISVKTRVGYNHEQIDDWIPALLEEDIAVLTLHARTRKEMSKVPADWSRVARVVALRDRFAPNTHIIGNGDVLSLDDARDKIAFSGADGAMVGRALFGNPWFFDETKSLPHRLNSLPTHGVDREKIITEDIEKSGVEYVSLPERLRVMVEHTKLFEELLPHKNFAVMKKHYKAYVNGFHNASQLRAELMEAGNTKEVEIIISQFLSHYGAD